MSRRKNGTNHAGAATGGNRYQGGYNKPKKCTAGEATPSGAREKTNRNNYNIQIPVEQEKMLKVMELIQLAIGINGMGKRDRELTGNLPTVFIYYSGHVSSIDFVIYETGYDYLESCDRMEMYIYEPIEEFNKNYDTIKSRLLKIKQEVPHELV